MKKLLILSFISVWILGCEKKPGSDTCINPDQINEQVLCTADYAPVCGCNGTTYPNACAAENYGGVTSYTEGVCGCTYKHRGVVVDYTGTDGCGLMIEMDNGKMLEPIGVPEGYTLVAGTHIEFDYRVFTTYTSNCMAGELADIICIRGGSSCEAVSAVRFNITDIFDEEVYINNAKVVGDCININFSHGGGCGQHDFEVRIVPVFGAATNRLPVLQLVHEGYGDICQALLTKERGYDLSALKENGKNSVDFILMDNGGQFYKQFTYKY